MEIDDVLKAMNIKSKRKQNKTKDNHLNLEVEENQQRNLK